VETWQETREKMASSQQGLETALCCFSAHSLVFLLPHLVLRVCLTTYKIEITAKKKHNGFSEILV